MRLDKLDKVCVTSIYYDDVAALIEKQKLCVGMCEYELCVCSLSSVCNECEWCGVYM